MSDYGYVGTGRDIPVPNRQEIKRTQVYTATHKGEGAGSRLPYMNRSFISFSFGSKKDSDGKEIPINIEDFNLIATIDGDRLQRRGYSEFEDLTSEYEVLDGHFYWGTHYTNHELEFNLATDGITQNQLDSFLYWFQPGKVRELILSEHPNRAAQARVASAPELHLLPFEEPAVKKIGEQEYKTSTTLYKGEITLTFVMEEPYWYSKINIFGYYDGQVYHDVWIDANGNKVNIFNDPDAIKIALEDNIPIAGMIDASMLLGDNTFADADTSKSAAIAEYDLKDDNITPFYTETQTTEVINGQTVNVISILEEEYIEENARIAYVENEDTALEKYVYGARLSGAVMSESSGIEEFAPDETQYFYYAGNAPSHPTIEFTLTPTFDGNGYINSPKNSYTEGTPYNTITFESLTKKEFQFTTPSVYTGYNQVVKILHNASDTDALVDIKKQIRNYVNHPAARAWANKVIDSLAGNTLDQNRTIALNRMKYFLLDEQGGALSSRFIINSKTGRATGYMKYRVPDNSTINNWDTYAVNAANDYSSMIHEEDVGDMVRSNYLIIEDQNQPNDKGQIVAWEDVSDNTKLYSHVIHHDISNGLQNVFIKYQNMYL